MDAFFVGQTYIDITLIADEFPKGDEKGVAKDYAVSFGGNAVTAAFTAAKLGVKTDLLTTLAPDWFGHMFTDMAQTYHINVHPRAVARSSVSVIMPKAGKRAILRARNADYLAPFPRLDISACRGLHLDGHQPEAAIYYAKTCREKGILTSLDGGGLRENTHELLAFIDIAIVAERLCEQMEIPPHEMLAYLKGRGVKIGGVTEGERGMLWYDESGVVQRQPVLPVPSELIIDTSGAGDVFHGAYMASYMRHPDAPWSQHFDFARAASTFKIQHLGNEAGLPSLKDIANINAKWKIS